jgi:hypothetical protein
MTLSNKGIGLNMIDCGSVTRRTRGLPNGFFHERAPPPFNWMVFT